MLRAGLVDICCLRVINNHAPPHFQSVLIEMINYKVLLASGLAETSFMTEGGAGTLINMDEMCPRRET